MKISSSIKSKFTSRNNFMKWECNPRSKKLSSTNSDIANWKEKCRLTFKSRKANLLKFKSKCTFLHNQRSKHRRTKRHFWGRFKKCKALLNKFSSTTRSKEINWINFNKAINFCRNKCSSERVKWLRLFSHSSSLPKLIDNWKHNWTYWGPKTSN